MTSQPTGLSYDAIIVVSFGGPEGMDDVMPFLENVLRGRNVPRERLLEVAKHYELFGGVSPLNEQNRQLITALEQELSIHGPRLPIYFGNRNWHPMLADALRQMRDDGVKNALAFVTAAYSSYSSCRQYLENIAAAQKEVGEGVPRIEKLRAFYNHPLFIEANAEQIRIAVGTFPEQPGAPVQLVFTAHSIPLTMAENCTYEDQLRETGSLIAEHLNVKEWQLVFQSRSGPPTQPWLGPDVCDYLRELKARGVDDVVIAPIGFICDHMEVIYDLDLEARHVCDEIGLNMRRAGTAGTHPSFVKMIRELISERLDPDAPRRFIGGRKPAADDCFTDCCAKS
jgi:ferrochelatase